METDNKHDKIFEYSNLFSSNFKLDCHSTKDLKIDYRNNEIFIYEDFISDYVKVAYHNLLSLNSLIEDLDNKINMAKFDII